jgi:hypothetical protein
MSASCGKRKSPAGSPSFGQDDDFEGGNVSSCSDSVEGQGDSCAQPTGCTDGEETQTSGDRSTVPATLKKADAATASITHISGVALGYNGFVPMVRNACYGGFGISTMGYRRSIGWWKSFLDLLNQKRASIAAGGASPACPSACPSVAWVWTCSSKAGHRDSGTSGTDEDPILGKGNEFRWARPTSQSLESESRRSGLPLVCTVLERGCPLPADQLAALDFQPKLGSHRWRGCVNEGKLAGAGRGTSDTQAGQTGGAQTRRRAAPSQDWVSGWMSDLELTWVDDRYWRDACLGEYDGCEGFSLDAAHTLQRILSDGGAPKLARSPASFASSDSHPSSGPSALSRDIPSPRVRDVPSLSSAVSTARYAGLENWSGARRDDLLHRALYVAQYECLPPPCESDAYLIFDADLSRIIAAYLGTHFLLPDGERLRFFTRDVLTFFVDL